MNTDNIVCPLAALNYGEILLYQGSSLADLPIIEPDRIGGIVPQPVD